MLKKSALILCFCLLLQPVFASISIDKQISQLAANYLVKHKKDEHISALGITLISPSSPTPISVYQGTKTFNGKIPIDENDLFQIGSITKSFIAANILLLENNPALNFSIDDPIDKYFPEYPRWDGITVRMLLNMTSGIPDYFTQVAFLKWFSQHPKANFPMQTWINYVYQQPLLFTPGTRFNYSNTNYFLLGLLIEKLTGKSIAENINTNFIKPLKLHHTFYVEGQVNSALLPYLVRGYQYENSLHAFIPKGADVSDYSLSYMNAAGGMISNSDDIAKWTSDLFTPNKVLSKHAYQDLISLISTENGHDIPNVDAKFINGYGLGIAAQYSKALQTAYYLYQGMTIGYRAFYIYIPSKQTLIAITVNSSFDGKNNHLFDLVNQLLALKH